MCFNIAKKIEEYRLTCQFMTINRIKSLFCLANKNFIFRLNIYYLLDQVSGIKKLCK